MKRKLDLLGKLLGFIDTHDYLLGAMCVISILALTLLSLFYLNF